jgi:hypothetical protein
MDSAEYIKRWLSIAEIRRYREGDNPHGIVLSRRQVYNIIHMKSKNFTFRNFLVQKARENESITKQLAA